MESIITSDHINEFKETGIVVIEGIISDEEVEIARKSLHNQLRNMGVDHDKILNGEETIDSGARLKSPASRIFYAKWKLLNIHLHTNVINAMKTLIKTTFASGKEPGFEHPMGSSDSVLAYIDRVCWRLPDIIRHEGGLGLHLDRNPVDPFLFSSGGLQKWRPIQSFVTLTDHFGSKSGGLRVVKGFHHKIDEYFKNGSIGSSPIGSSPIVSGQGGEFFRMHSKKYTSLAKECQPIYAPKGSLVCWDNRLPHSTCDYLEGFDTREVVYMGFIPNIELNKKYIKNQLKSLLMNIPTPAYIESDPNEKTDRDWELMELTDEQKELLGFNIK